MKPKIHPNYYNQAQVRCTCGNTFTTGSTKESIQVEIDKALSHFKNTDYKESIKILKGINITKATNIFTDRSPKDNVIQFIPVP